jgi:hypothetical protein
MRFNTGMTGRYEAILARQQARIANEEARRTLADIIRGEEPTTILGILIKHDPERRGIAVGEVATRLGFSKDYTTEVVAALKSEHLCGSPEGAGDDHIFVMAAHTKSNDAPEHEFHRSLNAEPTVLHP